MNSTEAQVHQTSDKPDEHQENGHTCVRKRTRATTEQLSVLESAFAANISPNTKLRKQLAEELQMSQRSIQIWFQNRRAKVKQLQKKAQMQMEQAAIQAQLQHYHQQQQQQQYNMMASFGVAHPPYPQQCQFQQQSSPQPFCFPPHCATVAPLVRAQSMDTVISYHGSSFSDITALSSIPTPGPEPYIAFGHEGQEYTMIIDDNNCGAPPPMYDIVDSSFTMSRRNMPSLNRWTNTEIQPICKRFDECLCSHEEDLLQDQNDFPDYIDGQISPSPSPSARFSSRYNSSSSSFSDENKLNLFETSDYNESSPTEDSKEKTPHLSNITGCSDAINGNLAALDATVSQISPIFTTLEEDATINPSSLILASFFSCFEGVSSSQRLNAETLTIGTWHRVNLPPSDLLCLFEIQQNALVWVINEGGGQFKIEIPLTHVTSIECLSLKNEPISDVHVYLSQSPLFYLDTPTEYGRQWIQCSDFTEDKQASRYLVHTLRGSPELAQDLSSLVYKKELQNIIHFIDPQHDALQIMSPVSTSILPSQHQYSTMTDSSAKYYIDTYPLLN